jgi:hypothetical protein
MSADDGDLRFVETTPPDDVITGGSSPRAARWMERSWWLALLVVAVLAAGIGIGYVLGRHTSKRAAGAPAPTSAPAPAGSAPAGSAPVPGGSAPAPAGSVLSELPKLGMTGSVCSAQPPGTRRLVLGAQVVNGDTAAIQFHYVRGVFPLGGLRMVDGAIGRCNDPGVPVPDSWLAPGATTWLRMTVDVQEGCPAPLPVHFQVDYSVNGAPASVTLAAFPDLGSVTYSGCPR